MIMESPGDCTELVETEWVEMKPENDDEGFGGMFDDPDPYETFTHSFRDGDEDIVITLKGHSAENGQTLNSTGLTLWRAAPVLSNFLLTNKSTYVENKGIHSSCCAFIIKPIVICSDM